MYTSTGEHHSLYAPAMSKKFFPVHVLYYFASEFLHEAICRIKIRNLKPAKRLAIPYLYSFKGVGNKSDNTAML